MRIVMIAAALALGISACGAAQKSGEVSDRRMPMLSAANTIEACLGRYPDLAAREAECVGQYSAACMDLTDEGDTNSGMIRCTVEEYDAWDARLNTAYGDLMQRLDASRTDGLRDAQRAWMALRDADCAFAASAYQGGTMQPLVQAGCMMDYAANRTLRLLDWIDQPG
ncbi:lysozyme inhibitor LprI family protein [Maricaulis sp.]|uniref:lysozyme inhibitor LprI family protein n=1 Tax=Maricaulis sp. TaxID=1486257 RepID=UPI003A90DD25